MPYGRVGETSSHPRLGFYYIRTRFPPENQTHQKTAILFYIVVVTVVLVVVGVAFDVMYVRYSDFIPWL